MFINFNYEKYLTDHWGVEITYDIHRTNNRENKEKLHFHYFFISIKQ